MAHTTRVDWALPLATTATTEQILDSDTRNPALIDIQLTCLIAYGVS